MEEETLDLEYNRPSEERSKFIAVLCVLSWIYVGISVLSGLSTAVTSQDELEEQVEISKAQFEESPMASNEMMQDMMSFTDESITTSKTVNLYTMILMLIEGAAVFMMFKQQKKGFWIYLAVQVLIIAVSIFYMPWPNMFSSLLIVFVGFFSALFLILYAVNLKHMK